MTCPLCGQRKARRQCPALGRQICPVCCGTKRRVEIQCPDDCAYLTSSRQHPPAVVQKQQVRDLSVLLPHLQSLSDRQGRLFILFQAVALGQEADPLRPLHDRDLADAAAAVAATFETAGKGIIYEHQAASLPAQRLVTAMRRAFDEAAGEGPRSPLERDAAIALRAVASAASEATKVLGPGDTVYLDMLRRVLPPPEGPVADRDADPADAPGSIIIP